MNNSHFHTKGRTLLYLSNCSLRHSTVLPSLIFNKTELNNTEFEASVERLLPQCASFAVRSSFIGEDSHNSSNAGKFKSILNSSLESLKKNALDVFNSNENLNANDEVLIQPMLENVFISGVVLTHDRDTNKNYRIVEYSESQDTTLVTSGKSKKSITKIYWKNSYRISNDSLLNSIGSMVEELELIFETDRLDIEFAFQHGQGKPFLLQVRPLVFQENFKNKASFFSIDHHLSLLENRLKGIFQSHPFLVGETTLLGVMPDWNPAEIIGVRPRPLALSLYRELITDGIWAYQRHNYGYRNLRSFPLMIDLLGQPYIDVRTSFNSFIPESLPDSIARKLVNGYIAKLKDKPSLHDKVEFEVVTSSMTLDFDQKTDEFTKYGLKNSEIKIFKDQLIEITKGIFTDQNPKWMQDKLKINALGFRRDSILNSNLPTLDKIYWLLEDCKRYGTLPFGGLARAAFISTQLLNSIESLGIINSNQKSLISQSTKTIASEISILFERAQREEFLKYFGHLRPGTYDITQPSYRESPDLYFAKSERKNEEVSNSKSKNDIKDIGIDFLGIEEYLRRIGINLSALRVFEFIQETIKLRESSKLEFTKNLSAALDLVIEYGNTLDLNPDDLSFLNYSALKSAFLSGVGDKSFLWETISKNKEYFEITKSIWLPPLISSEKDIFLFEIGMNVPNFIGQDCVESKISRAIAGQSIDHSIVLIENADPGYDWIFTSSIKGLITAYGGPNSHMAVRAGEFGLPCAIGVGQKRFSELTTAKKIRLDCLNRIITILS